ncbi:MAG: TRAP transporter small permease [Ignavibacteriales bacterium]|nr:TRAP transporter small permease [Ignavibacteriales bacterium]
MILTSIKKNIDFILKWVVIIIFAIMTINVLWQVLSRFILAKPSSFTEELARYMLVWIGILGASYVAGQKMHLAIDLLATKLSTQYKSFLEILIQFFVFVFALFVMVIGGMRLVTITLALNQISAALQIKLGFVYLILPISGLLMMFYSFYFIFEEINKLKHIVTDKR